MERDPQWGDAHDVGGGELRAASDGSLRHGRAAFAMVPVQNLRHVSAAHLVGEQGIAKGIATWGMGTTEGSRATAKRGPRQYVCGVSR